MGPSAVALPTSYPSLLRTAGFTDIVATDVTDEYASTQQRWIDATNRNEVAIRQLVGNDTFDERADSRRQTLRAVGDGLLSRFMYTAVR